MANSHKHQARTALDHQQELVQIVGKMYDCFARGDMASLKTDVFAEDIQWSLPGHHPLSGVKHGADETIAFFGALMQTGIEVLDVSFGTIGDNKVVEQHTGHGHFGGGDAIFPTCSVYLIEDGKIKTVTVYTADQHGVDTYFWAANPLAPIPDRLAH